MGAVAISIICTILINFISGAFTFVIDFILISESFMPTDVFNGLLDIDKEIFTAWLPYINWFIPLDYAVTLFGVFIDAYGTYIVWKYLKKIISSLLGNSGRVTKIIAAFMK